MLQNVHIAHHDEKGQQGEDDEVFHRVFVHLVLVFVFHSGEHDGLVGVAERLGDHGHDHGNLRRGAVDAQLSVHVFTFIYIGEQHLVGRLVEYAGHAEHQYGPAVAQHPSQHGRVQCVAESRELLDQQHACRGRADQVDVEREAHLLALVDGEVGDVEGYAEDDVEQFECGKLDGFLLLSEVGEGYAQKGVDGHRDCHHPHIVGMVGVAHEPGEWVEEYEHQGDEGHCHRAHADERGGVDAVGVFVRLVGEPEVGGLHSEGEQHEHQCRIGVHVGDDAVAARRGRHLGRVERHEQIVEEASDDA